ncbi:MAG: outer membrane beta-barrel protein [Bacteroidota bacterium]
MKTHISSTLAAIILLCALGANAQQKVSFTLHGTYAYGLNQNSEHYINPLPGYDDDEKDYYSYGTGTNIGLSAGYGISENIALNLDLTYIFSNAYEIEFYSENVTHRARMLNITPGIVMSAGYDKFNPYAKAGIVLGIGKIIIETEADNTYNEYYSKEELTGGLALGINGALGIEYSISEMFQIFAEASITSLSWAPEKAEYVTYETNGVDYLPNMTTSEKEVNFVNEYEEEYGMDDDDPDEPEKRLKNNYPFSNAGLRLGIKISL